MPPRHKSKAPPATGGLSDLPSECFDAIVERLPPNCIPLAIRQLNKELRQRYLQHITVLAKGDGYLPAWAVLAALPHLGAGNDKNQLMAALARRGDLEGMRQLAQHPQRSRNPYFNGEHALCAAASAGQLDAVRWLVEEQGCGKEHSLAISSAARGGQVHVLEWLRECGFAWDMYTFVEAARGGHVATLQWLLDNGCDALWGPCVVTAAAGAGRLEAVQHLVQAHGCPMSHDATEAAGRGGHLDVLRWCVEHGCQLHGLFHRSAAQRGRLDILQYLAEKGCSLALAASGAAAGAQKEVLLWLRAHGWQWTAYTCAVAAETGDVELLRWLREQTPPCSWDKGVLLAIAHSRQEGAAQCLEYALSNGCPWDMATFRRVQANPKLRHVHFPGVRRSARGCKD